jgi:hypothetical protein
LLGAPSDSLGRMPRILAAGPKLLSSKSLFQAQTILSLAKPGPAEFHFVKVKKRTAELKLGGGGAVVAE